MTADRNGRAKIRGYGLGDVSTVLSVREVEQQAEALAKSAPSVTALEKLVAGEPLLRVNDLCAGYNGSEILHHLPLRVGAGQALCLIGPNGAGKSTVLHALYGFAQVFSGRIFIGNADITQAPPNAKLAEAGIAYILQDNSIFPDMTVHENLLMGGFLLDDQSAARAAADDVLDRYPRLKARAFEPARVLSGGERRLLEISRALVMDPNILLVDEPSIGLEPRYIDMVFDILSELRDEAGKTIVMVEQNARKGLAFADIGYVLVAGQLAKAGAGGQLLDDPEVGRLFLGG